MTLFVLTNKKLNMEAINIQGVSALGVQLRSWIMVGPKPLACLHIQEALALLHSSISLLVLRNFNVFTCILRHLLLKCVVHKAAIYLIINEQTRRPSVKPQQGQLDSPVNAYVWPLEPPKSLCKEFRLGCFYSYYNANVIGCPATAAGETPVMLKKWNCALDDSANFMGQVTVAVDIWVWCPII